MLVPEVAWSEDSKVLVSGSFDHQVWPMDVNSLGLTGLSGATNVRGSLHGHVTGVYMSTFLRSCQDDYITAR